MQFEHAITHTHTQNQLIFHYTAAKDTLHKRPLVARSSKTRKIDIKCTFLIEINVTITMNIYFPLQCSEVLAHILSSRATFSRCVKYPAGLQWPENKISIQLTGLL